MKRFPTDLCLILDPSVTPDKSPVDIAEDALRGGVRLIQYRDKSASKQDVYNTGSELIEIARRHGAFLIINDSVELALALKSDGVHLGQEDFPLRTARLLSGPDRIIGASVHTADQAVRAEKDGADYLGVGPMFMSPTKQARPPLKLHTLTEIRQSVNIPLFAIGGISRENMVSVLRAGADGVACVSAVVHQKNIRKACEEILNSIHSFKEERKNDLSA